MEFTDFVFVKDCINSHVLFPYPLFAAAKLRKKDIRCNLIKPFFFDILTVRRFVPYRRQTVWRPLFPPLSDGCQTPCFQRLSKRWPFGVQLMAFYRAKGHLLEAERRPFRNPPQTNLTPTPTLPKGGSLITIIYLAANEALGNCHAARRYGIQYMQLSQFEVLISSGCRIAVRHDDYRAS